MFLYIALNTIEKKPKILQELSKIIISSMKVSLLALILTAYTNTENFFLPLESSKINLFNLRNPLFLQQAVLIEFEKGKISKITPVKKAGGVPKLFVAPGLIDIQINGFVGVDFSGPNLTVEDVRKVTKALWKEGVTSYFPTVITQDISIIKKPCHTSKSKG